MAEYDGSWSSHDRPMVEPWSSNDRAMAVYGRTIGQHVRLWQSMIDHG